MLPLFVILFPLLGFLFTALLAGHVFHSIRLIGWVSSLTVGCAFLAGLFLFFNTSAAALQQGFAYRLYTFIDVSTLSIAASLWIDSLSLLFVLIICGVGFLIHIFSICYMEEESLASYSRYFAYLNLFVFFMLVLVLGSNLFVTFIGWEGVGLCSYLLIGFWYKKKEYVKSANKAFIMNRIGDAGFLTASFILVYYVGSLEYQTITHQAASFASASPIAISLVALLLFFAATGKSAQLPLFTWLPDAMAGPTPVSALIHAATMVTGGIYLIVRCHSIIDLAPLAQHVMLFVGVTTAFMAATTAMVQKDIKKVLAYSTVSQLGFMVAALGVSAYTSAIFHVMTHAFFKALLFLGSGSIIYILHHEQLLAHMGGLKKYLPITHLTFLVGCFAIAGLPPFAGFFSKDEILLAVFEHSMFYYIVLQLTSFLTVCYMFRLYALAFLGEYRGKLNQSKLKETSKMMYVPLIVLAVFAFGIGWIGMPPYMQDFFGSGHFLDNYLASWSSYERHHTDVSTELLLTGIAIALTALGIWWSVTKYGQHKKGADQAKDSSLIRFFAQQWYLDKFYELCIVRPLYHTSNLFYNIVEINGFRRLPGKVEGLILRIAQEIRSLQSGFISQYFFWMTISLFAMLLFVFFAG